MSRPPRDLFGAIPSKAPTVYRCHECGQGACYGLGWPIAPEQRWFCPRHVPIGFLPKDRANDPLPRCA